MNIIYLVMRKYKGTCTVSCYNEGEDTIGQPNSSHFYEINFILDY
jgi:hypothetical protein